MSTRHLAPTSQWREPATGARAATPLYLVSTGIPDEYEFSEAGPGDVSLTLNGDGQYEIDPSGTARLAALAGGSLIVFGG